MTEMRTKRQFAVSARTAAFLRPADRHNGLHKLAHATLRNSKQNLFFVLAYNSFVVPIVAGLLHPITELLLSQMIAAVAMSLLSASVISIGLLLRRIAL